MTLHAPKQVRGFQAGSTKGYPGHRCQPAAAPAAPPRWTCRKCGVALACIFAGCLCGICFYSIRLDLTARGLAP